MWPGVGLAAIAARVSSSPGSRPAPSSRTPRIPLPVPRGAFVRVLQRNGTRGVCFCVPCVSGEEISCKELAHKTEAEKPHDWLLSSRRPRSADAVNPNPGSGEDEPPLKQSDRQRIQPSYNSVFDSCPQWAACRHPR